MFLHGPAPFSCPYFCFSEETLICPMHPDGPPKKQKPAVPPRRPPPASDPNLHQLRLDDSSLDLGAVSDDSRWSTVPDATSSHEASTDLLLGTSASEEVLLAPTAGAAGKKMSVTSTEISLIGNDELRVTLLEDYVDEDGNTVKQEDEDREGDEEEGQGQGENDEGIQAAFLFR